MIAKLNLTDTDRLYEVVNGQEVEIPHMGVLAGTVASLLAFWLNSFALPRKLGIATTEVLFRLRADSPERRPDLSFVPYERWPEGFDIEDDPAAWEVVPSLAVEVLSKHNTTDDIEEKLIEYFEAGVALVWVVHPRHRRIYVHQSLSEVNVLTISDALDGGTVLPGFTLPLNELFAALSKPT